MKILKLTLLLFLAFPIMGKAQQSITQNISGTITDGDNQQPIIGALIEIKKLQLVTVTDANGNFIIPKVPIGRLDISITSMSYEPVYMRQMLLTSTKELVINKPELLGNVLFILSF